MPIFDDMFINPVDMEFIVDNTDKLYRHTLDMFHVDPNHNVIVTAYGGLNVVTTIASVIRVLYEEDGKLPEIFGYGEQPVFTTSDRRIITEHGGQISTIEVKTLNNSSCLVDSIDNNAVEKRCLYIFKTTMDTISTVLTEATVRSIDGISWMELPVYLMAVQTLFNDTVSKYVRYVNRDSVVYNVDVGKSDKRRDVVAISR